MEPVEVKRTMKSLPEKNPALWSTKTCGYYLCPRVPGRKGSLAPVLVFQPSREFIPQLPIIGVYRRSKRDFGRTTL